MAYKIQHLKLGGILDQAIAVVKDHFWTLFKIMLCTVIPFGLLQLAVQMAWAPDISEELSDREMRQALALAGLNPANLALAAIGLFVVSPLATGAVIYAVAEAYLGKKVTSTRALKQALGKMGPLVWTMMLTGLAVMGGMILFIIPGILFALWFGLSQFAVMIENLSGAEAMNRSKQLVRPYLGTFMILGCVLILIGFLVGATSGLIPQFHLQVIATQSLAAVVKILSIAATVVFYFSCRCSLENFDLEHLAANLGESNAPQTEEEAGTFGPQFES